MNKAAPGAPTHAPSSPRASVVTVLIVAALLVIVGAAAIILKERSGAWWSPVLPPLGALVLLILGALLRTPGEPLAGAVGELMALPARNLRLGMIALVATLAAAIFLSIVARAEVARPDGDYWVQVYEGDNIEGQRVAGVTVVLERQPRGAAPQVLRETTNENGSATFPVFLNDSISLRLERHEGAEYYPVNPADVVTAEKIAAPQLINLAAVDEKAWKGRRGQSRPGATVRHQGIVAILQTDSHFFRWTDGFPQQPPIGSEELQSAVAPFGTPPAETIVRRPAYTVGFSPYLRLPRWVAYRILPGPPVRRGMDRFAPDPAIPRTVQATAEDYLDNAFDRGHLVRRVDVARSEELARSIFLHSVITPQTDIFNRRVWFAVEEYASRLAEGRDREVYVLRGPMFVGGPEGDLKVRLVGPGRIPVPTHFFQVVLEVSGTARRMHCFVVPNDFLYNDLPDSNAAIAARYRARLDTIEGATGLRVFPELQRSAAPGC